MSITFSLPQQFTRAGRRLITSCVACGGDIYGKQTPAQDCESCLGYGGDTEAENNHLDRVAEIDGEFNVANGNGCFILRDILNIHNVSSWGDVPPSTVLQRIATYYNPESGVTETTEEQGVVLTSEGVAPGATVIRCGRSLRQVESYVSRLKRLAEIAVERGCNIQWS
jgi:hypothetical protein